MKICANCFNDVELKQRITSLSKDIDKCDIHQKKEPVFDTEKNEGLAIRTDFLQLINLYSIIDAPTNSIEIPQMIADRLQSDWNLFSSELSNVNRSKILHSLLKENYSKDDPIFYKPVQMTQLKDKTFIVGNSILNGQSWSEFKESLLHKNRFFNKINEKLFSDILSWAKIRLLPEEKYFRGRIVDDFSEVTEVKDMLIPPFKKLDYIEGRLSPRGIGMLYLTTKEEIAIKEIRASFKDKIVIANGNLTKPVDVIDLSNITNISPFKLLNTDIIAAYQANKNTLRTIIKDLERPVRNEKHGLNYIPTQYISSFIQKEYDGIKYSSTMTLDKNVYNLVLFDESNISFNPEQFKKVIINSVTYQY